MIFPEKLDLQIFKEIDKHPQKRTPRASLAVLASPDELTCRPLRINTTNSPLSALRVFLSPPWPNGLHPAEAAARLAARPDSDPAGGTSIGAA